MGQFKQMVKMSTTEPSVILKLKKGGHVAMKSEGNGHKAMYQEESNERHGTEGSAPGKPSAEERREAMKPVKKALGGPMGAPPAAAANPMMRAALMKRAAQMAAMRGRGAAPVMAAPAVAAPVGALPAMKSGGKTGEVTKGKPGGFKSGGSTGGVRMGNAGGFKKGGDVAGANRPANSTPAGVTNTTTGEVKKANAGGFKDGGSPKKAYATGGSVNDAGRAVAMPQKAASKPVKNTMQSGTFKAGGKVEEKPNLRLLKTYTGPKGHVAKVYKDRDWDEHRVKFFTPEGKHLTKGDYHTDAEDAHSTAQHEVERGYKKGGKTMCKADGGLVDASKGAYDKAIEDVPGLDTAETLRGIPSRATDAVMRLLGKRPSAGAGRGFVNPPLAREAGQ